MRVSAALGLGCLLLSAVGPRAGWAQPTTLTFDELASQPVNGLSFMGVTFGFEIGGVASDDARYRASGPGTTKFLADPTLEGSASGILTLEFDVPTPILEFGVGLSTTVAVDPGITVELFDSGGSFTVLDVELPSTGGFAQTRFSHAGTPVRRAVIDFNETAAARFAIDNLTFDLTVDTDEDGIPDSVEKKNGLDPEDAADAGGDLDGDGLTNLEEFAAGTDMRNADTDGDGLGDAQEVQGGVTDPLDPDSDGDGALDGEDLFPGFVARVAIETPVAALTTERGMLVCRLEDPDGNLLAEAVRFTLTASGAARFADAATVGVVVAGGGTDAVTVETSGGLVEIELVDDLAETVALEVVDSEGFGVTVATSDLLADFEADDGGFLHSGSNDPWRWGVPRSGPAAAASGQRVWATNLTADYPDGVDSRLDSPEIDLPPGSSPRLSFQHYYLGECCCDFAWVQISLSGGAFQDLPGIRGNVGGNRFNCNATNQTYQEVTADLSEFAGESVRIRFRFTTDGSVTGPGWYIDDFQVTGIRAPRLVFLEPHEDADADGLSNAGELARDTDPFDDDTDGDGLLDGAETGTGIFVDVSDTGTDPLNPDSDGDGVSDGDEISRGGFPTDPASVPSGLSPVRVTAVSPASGPATGGTTLRVSGRGFVDGETSVTVGGVAAPAVTFVDSRNLDVVTPPNATGPVAIQVFIPGFTAGRESFTYTPHVLDVSPRIGLEGGGTAVTITGVGFLPGTTLAFDGQAALDVNLESDTLLTATTPAGSGFVDVTLSNADGESPRPRGFRYLPPLGDLDDDGVLNDAEFAAGTAPDDGDSDDDGLSDGVETNSGVFVDENDTGTDPLNPDTDGGGLADGVELSRGLDPLDAGDDFSEVPLPIVLIDGARFAWDIQQNGVIGDGTSDAFDGAFALRVEGQSFPNLGVAALSPDRERLVLGPAALGRLEVTRNLFIPSQAAGFCRYLEVLHNPGDEDVETTVQIFGNLGSDGSTQIITTSSGDRVLEPEDDWLVTDDSGNGTGDPTLAFVVANRNAFPRPSALDLSGDNFSWSYDVTVPAGGTIAVLHLVSQNSSRAVAVRNAEAHVAFERRAGETLPDGLSIVNFGEDRDGDGVPDGLETALGLDPTDPKDGQGDLDGDGLTNADEFQRGTDLAVVDTDEDGLGDGEEVNDLRTDPLNPDTDGDGVPDGVEVAMGADPLDTDSDDDGLPDGLEVALGLDPTDPADAADDLDGDGLTNAEEFELGTDLALVDSDGDGVDDRAEVQDRGTDPLNPDSDGDGAPDGTDLFDGFRARVVIEAPDVQITGEPATIVCRLENPDGELLTTPEVVRFTLRTTGSAVFSGNASVGAVVSGGGTGNVVVESAGGIVEIDLSDTQGGRAEIEVDDSEDAGLALSTGDVLLDFETDDGGFTHAGSGDVWRHGIPTSGPRQAVSGRRVWATNLTGDYPNNMNARLDSPELDLPAGARPELRFQHFFQSESGFDAGSVLISLDGGRFVELPGVRPFSGSVTGGSYREVVADLSSFAGRRIQIRFLFTSDGSVRFPGWYIDDFEVRGIGAPPRVTFIRPLEDEDSDGVTNVDEVARGTDPFAADTDGDGIPDGAETGTGVFAGPRDTGSDPLDPDTDGDGIDDGAELALGTDLLDPASFLTELIGDVLLSGDRLELGLSGSGTLGTKSGRGIQLVGEPVEDFLEPPGSHELVALRFFDPVADETRFFVNGPESSDIDFRNFDASTDATLRVVSVAQVGPLGIRQETELGVDEAFVRIKMTLTNLGATRLRKVRYLRSADPTIESEPETENDLPTPLQAVATGPFGATLVLGTSDPRGTASVEGGDEVITDPSDVIDSPSDPQGARADLALHAAVNARDLEPGETVRFDIVYAAGVSPEAAELAFQFSIDTDQDGLPDALETRFGLDPRDPRDAADDLDGDGLSNRDEFERGTELLLRDTDGDGLEDGEEVALGGSPLDPDTDGDGLEDGEEVSIFGTDLLLPDSDGDGFADGIEFIFGGDPASSAEIPGFPPGEDFDGVASPEQLGGLVPLGLVGLADGRALLPARNLFTVGALVSTEAARGDFLHVSFDLEVLAGAAGAGDGIAVFLAGTSSAQQVLGLCCGGLGVGGLNAPSLVVEIDLVENAGDPPAPHVGVGYFPGGVPRATDDALPSDATAPIPADLAAGGVFHFEINLSGSVVTVTMAAAGAAPQLLLEHRVDGYSPIRGFAGLVGSVAGDNRGTHAVDHLTIASRGPVDIQGVAPGSGPAVGGTRLRIVGSGLGENPRVLVGTEEATVLDSRDESLVALSPASDSVGARSVYVFTEAGGDVVRGGFTYTPFLLGVVPDTGPIRGGGRVTLLGSGFQAAPRVFFGQAEAREVERVSDQILEVTVPAGVAGVVNVSTDAGGAVSTLPRSFRHVRAVFVPQEAGSIQEAIAQATEGQLVLVGPGRYAESVTLERLDVELRSVAGPDETTIAGSGAGPVIEVPPGGRATLRGFTVEGGRGAGGSGIVAADRSRVVLEDLVVTRNAGPLGRGITLGESVAFRIDRVAVLDNLCGDGDGGGILVGRRSRGTVSSSLIAGNVAGKAGGGIALEAGANVTLTHLTIVANRSAAGGGGVTLPPETDSLVVNSIIRDNLAGGARSDVQGGRLENFRGNNIRDNPFPGQGGNSSVNPRFVDAAAGDYRLDGLSPLVDAGELEAAMGLVLDLSGSPRLVDSDGDGEPLPDLGAFESQPSDGTFLRGDTDTDGVVQLDDAVSALSFLFLGAAEPSCLDAVDADDNGLVDLADAVRILGFLFLGSPPPPAPGPFVCGADPTADVTPGGDLGCKSFAACP